MNLISLINTCESARNMADTKAKISRIEEELLKLTNQRNSIRKQFEENLLKIKSLTYVSDVRYRTESYTCPYLTNQIDELRGIVLEQENLLKNNRQREEFIVKKRIHINEIVQKCFHQEELPHILHFLPCFVVRIITDYSFSLDKKLNF